MPASIHRPGDRSRDSDRFEDLDTFYFARKPNGHRVFGIGPAICIGKGLIRLTGEAVLCLLMDRFSMMEKAGGVVWLNHRDDRHGLESLPLQLG